MHHKVVTFYDDNINPELVRMQKKIFDHFGIPIDQIKTTLSHPDAIDNYLLTADWDFITIFDIDCIPLNNEVVDMALIMVMDGRTIYGAAQKASHIPGSEKYIGPSFISFSKRVYDFIGWPSFKETEHGDVGSQLTYQSPFDVRLVFLYPYSVEKIMWNLDNGYKFGYGTNYENIVYHGFESNANHHSTKMFINKCREILEPHLN